MIGEIMLKKIVVCLLLLSSKIVIGNQKPILAKPSSINPIPLLIAFIGGDELASIATIIAQDCSFTGQCNTHIKKCISFPTEKIMKEWSVNFPLVILINEINNGKSIEWRLYNCLKAEFLIGKKYYKKTKEKRVWAHAITDQFWTHLTGQKPVFSSRIVYCKEIKNQERIIKKQICIADITGENEQILVDDSAINTAPRFNRDVNNPLVFFSQHTQKNLRLLVIDQQRRKRIVSDFDGINMLPAFNNKGDALVYCISHKNGACHLYYYSPGDFKCLIRNKGRNVSPTFGDNDLIYFCSDFETDMPSLYSYSLHKKNITKITQTGYCACPRFSPLMNKLVYSKIVNGTMQLMIYDINTAIHEQLTFDRGNKEEATWSPCGNYLLYSYELHNMKRLALYNCVTKSQKFITPAEQSCSFADWSLNYKIYPIFS